MGSRITYLDGLRGVAILLVLAYHAYSRWSNLVPYGDQFSSFPVFKFGWLGVQLFFLISGFVIFMTLDRTDRFTYYIYKRWLRLFPAMLIISIFVYITSPYFWERPAGIPELINLLPGLTFIEARWWEHIFNIDIGILEGTYWSLYVEFKFYIIAGIIYYGLGRHYLAPLLFFLYLLSILTLYVNIDSVYYEYIDLAIKASSINYFGWFAAGSMLYLYYSGGKVNWFWGALCVSVISSLFVRNLDFNSTVAAIIISFLFSFSIRYELIQDFFKNKLLIYFGIISYPLYLVHENMMISMIIKMDYFNDLLNYFFYPFFPIATLSLFSYYVTNKCEPYVKHLINSIIKK